MQKIVVIGGGTGSYTLLRGLKKYETELTAIVSMMDSGGSTGRLRDEFGFLPPGDVRRCLLALSPDTSSLRNLFEYRFKKGMGLNGHSLGNLFLTALRDITGNEAKAIEEASKLLGIKGKVLPVTTNHCHLGAILENKQVVVGETNIDIPRHDAELKIKKLFLAPKPRAYKGAVKAILEADKIVIGPGDLYTSVLPNILVSGMKQAIAKSKAKKIYVCNIMTKRGETTNYKASDFVREIEKYLGEKVINYVICNNKKPAKNLLAKYKKEQADFVEPDLKNTKKLRVVKTNLLDDIHLARHDPDKLAKTIIELK
ncbi:MAG: YvcK family protein [Nanoarchaeota archaeon]|nr:YvcK family protein [Nanoarchaeota archaeon]MBU1321426.1 YvcK family protein [Nanoarchaeota archaeon]MBU1597052.1 YvcK family protein [Nanoarchaeota archaeon]MBU2440842.1 YvcK family protein [Nanoarchaeota archaeon]